MDSHNRGKIRPWPPEEQYNWLLTMAYFHPDEIGPADDFDFAGLMVRFVADEAFVLRRDDAEEGQ